MQAVVPSRRTEPIIVVVHQCPAGARSWTRSPRGARPRHRGMFVLAADSSRNTSLAAVAEANSSRQAVRAKAISSRSCSLARSVFFIGQPQILQDVMDEREVEGGT